MEYLFSMYIGYLWEFIKTWLVARRCLVRELRLNELKLLGELTLEELGEKCSKLWVEVLVTFPFEIRIEKKCETWQKYCHESTVLCLGPLTAMCAAGYDLISLQRLVISAVWWMAMDSSMLMLCYSKRHLGLPNARRMLEMGSLRVVADYSLLSRIPARKKKVLEILTVI